MYKVKRLKRLFSTCCVSAALTAFNAALWITSPVSFISYISVISSSTTLNITILSAPTPNPLISGLIQRTRGWIMCHTTSISSILDFFIQKCLLPSPPMMFLVIQELKWLPNIINALLISIRLVDKTQESKKQPCEYLWTTPQRAAQISELKPEGPQKWNLILGESACWIAMFWQQ